MNKVGRPKAFETPDDMQEAIDAYFEECDNNVKFDGENYIPDPTPYTVTGLAVSLGLDRKTIFTYGKEESHKEFHPVIKKARDKVLENMEVRGLNGESSTAFSIFLLKNHYGYSDKTEQEVTSNNTIVWNENKTYESNKETDDNA